MKENSVQNVTCRMVYEQVTLYLQVPSVVQ